jgi:hypothetical protein
MYLKYHRDEDLPTKNKFNNFNESFLSCLSRETLIKTLMSFEGIHNKKTHYKEAIDLLKNVSIRSWIVDKENKYIKMPVDIRDDIENFLKEIRQSDDYIKTINLEIKKCTDCPYIRKESPKRGICNHPNSDRKLIFILGPIPHNECPLETKK